MALQIQQLVGALARAVVDAQHQIQVAQLADLARFFKDDVPISVTLHLPRVNPSTGQTESMDVRVPLITLVNPTQLSIRELQLTLQVDINDILQNPPPAADGPPAIEYSWGAAPPSVTVEVSTSAPAKPGSPGTGQLTLKVAANETSEGLARLLDHLNKAL